MTIPVTSLPLFQIGQPWSDNRGNLTSVSAQFLQNLIIRVGGPAAPSNLVLGQNSGVASFNTRTGIITLQGADVTTALGFTPYNSSNPAGYGSGTVTSVSVLTANGISAAITNPTTTPAITLTLGAITPTTVNPTGAITPVSTSGIVGTTSADNANAGSVGEYVTSTATTGSLSSGVPANVTSLSLTAGDWDVDGNVLVNPAATTTVIYGLAGISTTSATLPADPMNGLVRPNQVASDTFTVPAPKTRVNVSTTTVVYLVVNALFTTSTCTATGMIQARRIR